MKYLHPDEDRNIEELIEIFDRGEMGVLVHNELRLELVARENQLVKDELEELITKNAALGGSPSGFYYKNQLFGSVAALTDEAVTEVHESLETEARLLKENRQDIPQYATYIAHFMGYLDTQIDDPVVWVANLIPGMSQFSKSLKRFESYFEQKEPERLKMSRFNREDESKATYFNHYDRVERPLQRFLFRKLTT